MTQCGFLLALVLLGGASAFSSRGARGFLAADMRPEAVATKLVSVEDEWWSEVDECSDSSCAEANERFSGSCATIVTAMVQGSSGTKDVIKEYMGDVCGAGPLDGWRREECQNLALSMDEGLSADSYDNRENFNASRVCDNFWSHFVQRHQAFVAKERAQKAAEQAEEAKRVAEEKKKEAEERQKEAEEQKKKEAEEAKRAAEEKKKEAEEKKKEADEQKKKEAEEQKKEAEEQQKKAEAAKAKADDAQAKADKAAQEVKEAEAAKAKADGEAKAKAPKATAAAAPKK